MSGLDLQNPGTDLDYSNDWTGALNSGDDIASRQWTITPDSDPSLLNGATSEAVTVMMPADAGGKVFRLTEAITTNNGVRDKRSLSIRCAEY